MEAYFASTNHRIKSRVGWFFKHQGLIRVFQAMVRSSKYAANRRATATATAEIADTIKHDILRLVLRIFQHEMQAVAKDPRSRVDPDKITPIDCAEFSFTEIQTVFEEKSPTLWKAIRILAGTRQLLDSEDGWDDIDKGTETETDGEHNSAPSGANGLDRNNTENLPDEESDDTDYLRDFGDFGPDEDPIAVEDSVDVDGRNWVSRAIYKKHCWEITTPFASDGWVETEPSWRLVQCRFSSIADPDGTTKCRRCWVYGQMLYTFQRGQSVH